MKELVKIADSLDAKIKEKNIEKAAYSVVSSISQELNVDSGELTMLRTMTSNRIYLTVINENKKGFVEGNDISEEGIDELISNGIEAAEVAPADEAYDIAPREESETFEYGEYEPDLGKFMELIKEFLEDIKKEFPKLVVMNIYASHTKVDTVYRNTNGSNMVQKGGKYGISVEYTSTEGEKTNSFDYTGILIKSLDKPIIDMGDFRKKFTNSEKALNKVDLNGKFEGTVILSPNCLTNFFFSLVGLNISNSVILDGTSKWIDKLETKVIDERISVALDPKDERIVEGENITYDGFKTEKLPIFDKGVLKNFYIDLYTANKTGKKVSKNTGYNCIFEPGDSSLDEMIKSVKRGIYLERFSGGEPSSSGEISGVAKNSFYIEDGEIKGAVEEVMISGILEKMFNNVNAISKECMEDGSVVVPYMSVDGMTISGKSEE